MEPSGQEMAGGAVACVVFLFVAIIGLATFAFWLWMLIDAIKNTPSENNLRLIWILVIVFTGIIGALIYLIVQRPKNPLPGAEPPPPPPAP